MSNFKKRILSFFSNPNYGSTHSLQSRKHLFHRNLLLIQIREKLILQRSFWDSCKELQRLVRIIVQVPGMFVEGICTHRHPCASARRKSQEGNWFFLSTYYVLGCFVWWWSLSLHSNSVNKDYLTGKEMKFRVVIWRGPQCLSSKVKFRINFCFISHSMVYPSHISPFSFSDLSINKIDLILQFSFTFRIVMAMNFISFSFLSTSLAYFSSYNYLKTQSDNHILIFIISSVSFPSFTFSLIYLLFSCFIFYILVCLFVCFLLKSHQVF